MHISADSNSSKAIPKQYHLDASVAEGWRGRERHQEQKRVSKNARIMLYQRSANKWPHKPELTLVTRYKHTNNSKTMYVRMQRVIINILLREGRGWRASLVRHPLEESAEDMCS